MSRQITNIQFENIDHKDYPDYCDAYISYACWSDTGEELTEEELDDLNNQSDLVYNLLIEYIF